MAAISQTKLMITAKYDVMAVAQNPSSTPQQGLDASARLERIAKTLTSNLTTYNVFQHCELPLSFC